MIDWFRKLAFRERILVLVAASLLGILLIYLLLIRPFQVRNIQLLAEVEQKQQTLTWMKQAAIEVRKLEASQQLTPPKDERDMVARVSSVLEEKHIKPDSIRPEGPNRLTLILNATPLSKILERLDYLRKEFGVRVNSVTFEPVANKPGLTNVRAVLER